MDWLKACGAFLNRPKVVHSLPGRLRVHVPFLQKLPKQHEELAERLATLLAEPEEISSATANLVTGNALVCYDPARASEGDVIGYLRSMFEIFVRNRERFEGLEPEDVPRLLENLQAVVRDAVKPGLKVNGKMVLESDVLE